MIDTILYTLADPQRRQLLVGLLHHEPQYVSKLSDDSREIADANPELLSKHLSSSRAITGANEELLRLYHVHLPRLAADGFIEWNRDTRVVTRGARFDELRPLLELLDDREDEASAVDPIEIRPQ